MRRKTRTAPSVDRARVLADEVEGYLLARTHLDQARREAADFCSRMPWLTTAQAEDVTQHYLTRRMDLTRCMLLATVERAAQLRQEYEIRYSALRRDLLRRHAVGACAVLACAGGVSVFVSLLSR
ncbi:hypothetical protein [Streptomyces sp. NPDC050287]|uniref:hypothetical protein n=1 Tax=Streptomyces sp. NPDC050287 TaxID=3365608 RepID=UPI0037A2D5FE